MTRRIRLSSGNSPYIGRLAKGCRACMKGAKLVVFITGRCTKDCFYCPISEERYGTDVIFANEIRVNQIKEAVTEARMIDAEGMGITGGEPLLELDRTCRYIRHFKSKFGKDFHIHLYSAFEPIPRDVVKRLLHAGLDELRLHRFTVGEDLHLLRQLTLDRADLGVEIPSIPGQLTLTKKLLFDLDQVDLDFININELELTPLNAEALRKRKMKLADDSIAAVKGSEEQALTLLEWAAQHTSLNIHYCPIALKDGVQLRNRFLRRAKHVVKPFEQINQEGLLVKGVIIPPRGITLTETLDVLERELQIPIDYLWINTERRRVETAITHIRKFAKRLKSQGFRVGIVEEYPIDNRFQVAYTPL